MGLTPQHYGQAQQALLGAHGSELWVWALLGNSIFFFLPHLLSHHPWLNVMEKETAFWWAERISKHPATKHRREDGDVKHLINSTD